MTDQKTDKAPPDNEGSEMNSISISPVAASNRNATTIEFLAAFRDKTCQSEHPKTTILEEPELSEIPLTDIHDEDNNAPSAPNKPGTIGDTSTSELVDVRIFSIITERAVIAELRHHVDLLTMGCKQIDLPKNIASSAERFVMVKDRV